MKGEPKNRTEAKKAKEKAKFPMRTITVGRSLLEYNQEFFEIYDFIFLMFIVSMTMFVIVTTL